MPEFWSHKNSVTRDFVMLSVAIVFIAIFTSAWLAYTTIEAQSTQINKDLALETTRIDRIVNEEIARASYLLRAIGKQIIRRGTDDHHVIAQMLGTYDLESPFYNAFLWIDANQMVVTNSRQGLLERPLDVSDRAYVKRSLLEPFKVHIGKPWPESFSNRRVIPLGMGLTDFTGKYIGTITLNLDISHFTQTVYSNTQSFHGGFAILDQGLLPIITSDLGVLHLSSPVINNALEAIPFKKGAHGILSRAKLFSKDRIYSYYRVSDIYPHLIVATRLRDWQTLTGILFPRLLQLSLVAAFLVSLLWLVRFRVIFPIQTLGEFSTEIARGNTRLRVPKGGPKEISALSQQLQNIADYITERKLIEEELVSKVLALKTAKDMAKVDDEAKMAILSLLHQEIFPSLDKVLGAASILHDQPYGPIQGKEYLAGIHDLDRHSARLAKIIHEIFEFPKSTKKHSLTAQKPVDVEATLRKCVTLLEGNLTREEVEVNIHTPGDLPRLVIHELYLMHVILYLLNLCIRSIPAGGEIKLEAALEDKGRETEFAIYFKDNGSGLDTQNIAEMWRATEQSESDRMRSWTNEESENSLQAITLTKKIITLYDGRISMENQPDKEAVIALYFQQ